MDPVLYGITIGVLITSGIASWVISKFERSQQPAKTITTDIITDSSSNQEKQ